MTPRRYKDEELSAFGKAVERWRQEKEITQAVLARLIGTHQRTLSHWLRVGGTPDAAHQLARLALLMGTPVEELFAEDADLEMLRDPAYVEQLLRAAASSRSAQKYLNQRRRVERSSEQAEAPHRGERTP